MKYAKKPMALILSLVLCMGLSACGNDPPKPPPDSFEGMVKESKISEESSRYLGSWQGEEENRLEIEKSGETEEVRVALYDAKGEIYASGYLQPVKKYGADYFYNEHDGMAHRTWIDSENSDVLRMDAFGIFTRAPEGAEEESFDFQPLEGTWAMDGAKNPKSVLDIDDEGGWHLRERPGKKGKFKEVDSGTLRAKGEGRFEAVSDDHEGVVYDMTVVDKKTLYWGGENDHYQKMK